MFLRRFSTRWMRGVLLGALGAMLLTSAGCTLFGYVAYMVMPPESVKAMYKPPQTPMLVLVENRENPGMLVGEADQLTSFIMDDLVTYEVAPLVAREKLQQLRDTKPDMDKLTISQLGKELGAKQVLYVDLKRISIGSIAGVPAHGRVEARVHVVDVESGRTMFPSNGAAGWPVSLETPVEQDVKESDLPAISVQLLRATGTNIGRMFHKYTTGG